MPKKILIVDDEPDFLMVIEERLRAHGYDIVTGNNGEEALHLAKTQKLDLIILDVMMPKTDGFKVCGLLKGDTRYKNIPVIMLTARAQGSDKETAAELGADAYLIKPVKAEVLAAKVKELLEA